MSIRFLLAALLAAGTCGVSWGQTRPRIGPLRTGPARAAAGTIQPQLVDGSVKAVRRGAAVGGLASGPTLAVDLQRMADLIEEKVNGKCVGWQFAIFRDAQLAVERAGGKARNAADEPARNMSTTDRLEIASCSKTITALATLKALEEKGLSIDQSIGPYVPPSWDKHASIDGVTFQQLLSHKSGLKKTDALDDYEDEPGKANLMVKSLFQIGVIDPAKGYDYENLNYKVLQVLLPYVVNPSSVEPLEDDPAAHDVAIGEQYIAIVRQRVFVPAQLGSNVFVKDWHPSGSDYAFALAYDASNPSAAGIPNSDGLLGAGPGGWTVTARQLAQVIAAWEAGHLVSPGTETKMKQLGLGMGSSECSFGTCYTHNGGYSDGSRGGGSRWIAFPGNVQVALIYNSANNSFDYDSTFDLIKDCYEQAAGQSDLVITSLVRTAAPFHKDGFWHIPVKMTVKNQGSGLPPHKFVNAVKLGSDWRWSGFMDPLAGDSSATSSGTVKIKDAIKKMAGQTIELVGHCDAPIAAADTSIKPYARVKESNESNNQKTLSVQLPGGLDLASPTNAGEPTAPNPRVPKRIGGKKTKPSPTPSSTPQRVPTRVPTRTSKAQ